MAILNNSNKDRIVIDVICALYLFFLAPTVVNLAKANIVTSEINSGTIFLGIVLFVLNILEVFFVAPILSSIYYEVKDEKTREDKTVSLLFLMLMHAVMTIFVNMMALQLFGINFNSSQNVVFIAIGLMIVKEIFFVVQAFTKNKETLFNSTTSTIFIALYSCLIFSIFWDGNLLQAINNQSNWFNLIPIALFFALFYYSLRLPIAFNILFNKPSVKDRIIGILSFLLVFLSLAMKKF